MEVIYEDNHLLGVNKPALLATMGVTEGTASVVTEAKRYLKQKYQKPGNVYLGVVSRLDTGVSGVLVLARTSKAAARLTEQFRESKAEKTYWAAVEQAPPKSEDALTHWLLKSEKLRRMTVVKSHSTGAQRARLSYRVLQTVRQATLLEVSLETGRKHQIRVHLASEGHPILGDALYGMRGGPAVPGYDLLPKGGHERYSLQLHCWRESFVHPVTGEKISVTAPVPESFCQLFGGREIERALAAWESRKR